MYNIKTLEGITTEVRKALKDKGYSNRQVSVRGGYHGYDKSLTCVIKDLTIPKAEVEEIAGMVERIDRDKFGEVLAGGNMYVHVEFDNTVLRKAGMALLYETKKMYIEIDTDDGIYILIDEWASEKKNMSYRLFAYKGANEFNDIELTVSHETTDTLDPDWEGDVIYRAFITTNYSDSSAMKLAVIYAQYKKDGVI